MTCDTASENEVAPTFFAPGLARMLPLSALAARVFAACDGRGMHERQLALSPASYDQSVRSSFGDVSRAGTVRSFDLAAERVVIHTNGRRPSWQTVRTVRATLRVLTQVYGPCPHAALQVFLADDPAAKALPPAGQPVTVAHINSGFNQGAKVVVLRCAEMHRTLVHELVHAWKTHSLDRPAQQRSAHRELGAPAGCLLTEAFVEAVTWLIHGGYCQTGLDPAHALRTARAYLGATDDGRTNGWAYFVGRALLVADGGARFHAHFFRSLRGTTLVGADAHGALVRIMAASYAALGGAGLPRAPPPGTDATLRLCNCSLGASFAGASGERPRL